MNYYISYFYKIRFFTPDMLPLSTAVWDPKWYHNFKDQRYIFKDKNGVYNGLRVEMLNPEKCNASGCPCEFQKKGLNGECSFIKSYKKGLREVNFLGLMNRCNKTIEKIKEKDGTQINSIVFIVHETPNNPCSERSALIDYFKEHGIDLKEWN